MTSRNEVDWSAVDGLSPAVLAGLHWHGWSAVEQPVPAVQVSGAARAGRLVRVPDAVLRTPSAVVSFVDLHLQGAGAVFAVWIPVQVARACGLVPATVAEGVWLDIADRETVRLRVLDAVLRTPSAVVSFVDLQLDRAGAVFTVWIPVRVARACGLVPATVTEGVWLDVADRETVRLRVLMVAAAGCSVHVAARQHTRIEVSVEAVTAVECGGRCADAVPGTPGGGQG